MSESVSEVRATLDTLIKIMKMRYTGGKFDKKASKVPPKSKDPVERLAIAIAGNEFNEQHRKAIYEMFEVHYGKPIKRPLGGSSVFRRLPTSISNGYRPGEIWRTLANPNSHNYGINSLVVIIGHDHAIKLSKAGGLFLGNHLPDEDDNDGACRPATKAEAAKFIKEFSAEVAKLTAKQVSEIRTRDTYRYLVDTHGYATGAHE